MAHHKSAEKRARASVTKNTRNRAYMSSVRTAIKKVRAAAEAKEAEVKLVELFTEAQSLLMRAAKRGIIHKNNASRRISRMAHLIKATIVAA